MSDIEDISINDQEEKTEIIKLTNYQRVKLWRIQNPERERLNKIKVNISVEKKGVVTSRNRRKNNSLVFYRYILSIEYYICIMVHCLGSRKHHMISYNGSIA
jgi:hypothetical protein